MDGPENPLTLGARIRGADRCTFKVWAPKATRVDVHFSGSAGRRVSMRRGERGYFEADVEDVHPGSLYRYVLDDGRAYPDPASRFQPHGVHGPSRVVDPESGRGEPDWRGVPAEDLILYELHVGTFTPEGTFDGVRTRLEHLRALGVTAVELMPVAQFPGDRNWGYDGVGLYAVQASYGGPAALKRLIRSCHGVGIAVILDVVYNHLGPEGNYLHAFGPYFSDTGCTPWGDAVNFDGAGSHDVRRFFLENALHWVREYRVDGLRLDALHAIAGRGRSIFLGELVDAVRREERVAGRKIHLFGESIENDGGLVETREGGGAGLDAVWNDDFHHALHVLLTGEMEAYYRDFGRVEHLAAAMGGGFVYAGACTRTGRRRRWRPPGSPEPGRFIHYAQNHDQVGNRLHGERLSDLVPFEAVKLAAGAVLLSPGIPLLFMGEEYGERAPFLYFTSHSDPGLQRSMREARQREFADRGWQTPPPDPQDRETCLRSRLDLSLRESGRHAVLFAFYRELIRLRKEHPVLGGGDRREVEIRWVEEDRLLFMHRKRGTAEVFLVFNFLDRRSRVGRLPLPPGKWVLELASADVAWDGPEPSPPRRLPTGRDDPVLMRPFSFMLFGLNPAAVP